MDHSEAGGRQMGADVRWGRGEAGEGEAETSRSAKSGAVALGRDVSEIGTERAKQRERTDELQ